MHSLSRVYALSLHDALPISAGPPPLDIDAELTAGWLVSFLREEFERRSFEKAVVGLSGGVDSAVTAFLSAQALGAENVVGVRIDRKSTRLNSSHTVISYAVF